MSLEDELAEVVAHDDALHAIGLHHIPDQPSTPMNAVIALFTVAGRAETAEYGPCLFFDMLMVDESTARLLIPVSSVDESAVHLLHAAASRLEAMLTEGGPT